MALKPDACQFYLNAVCLSIPETKTNFLIIWIQSEKSLFQPEMQWLGLLYVFTPEIQSSSMLEQKNHPNFPLKW